MSECLQAIQLYITTNIRYVVQCVMGWRNG